MRDLAPCDLDWIEHAPQVVRVTTHFKAQPAQVFAAFADAATWPRWFPLMTSARWLGAPGGGALGKEREVKLTGLGTFVERFIAWDEPDRFAFTVVRSTSPMMKKFGEDYRLVSDNGGTRFDWTMGAEPAGAGKLLAPGLRIVMRRLLARAGKNLDRELRSRA
jgi:hypothetical protein